MTTALRFIHTADWQLGYRAHFVPGDAGASVREARLRTVERIGALAREHRAAFVVVAGDVFEHHGLRTDTLRKTFDVLRGFQMPVFLLPGNHDPYTPESLYRGPLWRRECPANVQVLGDCEPVVRDHLALLPCPLRERHTLGDVTDHLTDSFGPGDCVRVGVAHGTIKEFFASIATDEEPHNIIPVDLASRARLDYLALGDWHGTREINARTWYSGTPEPTRFKEQDPGHVLLVEIPAPGARPTVVRQEVCALRWRQLSLTLNGQEDLQALESALENFSQMSSTLLELTLTGVLELGLRTRLEDEILARAGHRFHFLRVRDEALHTSLGDQLLATLPTEGWIGQVVARLQGGIEGTPKEPCDRALRLLYQIHQRQQDQGGAP